MRLGVSLAESIGDVVWFFGVLHDGLKRSAFGIQGMVDVTRRRRL